MVSNPDDCVYITQGNWTRALKSVDGFHDIDHQNVYDQDLTSILSVRELRLLALTRKSFEDPKFWSGVHVKVRPKTDTKTFVFEGGSPAYHLIGNCPKLTADYTNLVIPEEIKAKGDEAIDRFRGFCRQNRHLLESDLDRFYTRLEAQFFLKNVPQRIHRDNSGATAQHNMDLSEVKDLIDNLLLEAEEFRNRDEETRKKIKNQGYGTHRVPEAKEEGSALYIWHNEYKNNLKSYLQTYFRIRFNPELRFYGRLLDEIGFIKCAHCHQ